MRVEDKPNKRAIEFDKIREGTVLKCRDTTYIKGSNGAAVNLENGKVVYPANDLGGHWDECYIFPGATVSLHGRKPRVGAEGN